MRKLALMLAMLAITSTAISQQIPEPEFIGEAIIVTESGEIIPLAIEYAMTKTRANAALYLFGMGSIKSNFYLEGVMSHARVTAGEDFSIIIRAANNDYSPSGYIKIFRFDLKSNRREAEISSVGTFSGASTNNFNYIPFMAKKYGSSSYLIKIKEIGTGEYGIKLNEENNTISTFGAQGSPEKMQEYVSYMVQNHIAIEITDNTGTTVMYDVPAQDYIPKNAMLQIYGKEYISKIKEMYKLQLSEQYEQELEQRKQERAEKKKKKTESKAKKREATND